MFDEAPVTLALGDAGVTLRTAHKELLVKWDGVAAVARTPTLFVFKTVGDLRLLLPLRAVGGGQDVRHLEVELRRFVPPLAAVAPSTSSPRLAA